jgi:hypothetical protein
MKVPKKFLKAAAHKDGKTQLNGNLYVYCFVLANDKGESIQLQNKYVHALTVYDNITDIFCSGTILIDNTNNLIENFYKPKIFPGMTETDRPVSFKLNGNDYDMLFVKIKPKAEDATSMLMEQKRYPDALWDFTYAFNIFDTVERDFPGTIDKKSKQFMLRDVKESILSNTNLQWSVSEMLKELDLTKAEIGQVSNTRKSVYTGLAIKSIIKKTFEKRKYLKKKIENKFTKDWDRGGSKIFHSNLQNQSAMDCIETCLDSTISDKDSDNCFLKYERVDGKTTGIWALRSISDYFSKAFKTGAKKLPGEFHIDIMPTSTNDGEQKSLQFGIIAGGTRKPFNIKMDFAEFKGMKNFSYDATASCDSMCQIISQSVINYNSSSKAWNVNMEDHHIDQIIKDGKELMGKKMKTKKNKPNINIPVNDFKKTNQALSSVYTHATDKNSQLAVGRNKVLRDALYFSPSIKFELAGLTYRRSGRFMSLICTQGMPDTSFNDIFQGEWFITQVQHIFTGGNYRNAIQAVKVYSYQPLFEDKKSVASLIK